MPTPICRRFEMHFAFFALAAEDFIAGKAIAANTTTIAKVISTSMRVKPFRAACLPLRAETTGVIMYGTRFISLTGQLISKWCPPMPAQPQTQPLQSEHPPRLRVWVSAAIPLEP